MHATLINCSLALTSCWCLVSALALIEKIPVNRSCTQFGFCSMMPAASTSLSTMYHCVGPGLVQFNWKQQGWYKVGHDVPSIHGSGPSGGRFRRDNSSNSAPLHHRHKMSNGIFSLPSKLCHYGKTLSHPNANGWKQQSKVSIRYLTPKLHLCLSVSVSPLELVSVLQKKKF